MDNKKNGIPKLRFPGFTGAWEQRKLGEEFKRVNERNNGEFGKDRWISVAKMYFQDPDKVTSNNIDTRTYVMRFGDIAFEGHPNNEFKFGRFVANDIGDGVISELFPIYRHIRDYDNNYWKYAIHLERIMGPIFAKSITSSGNSSNKLAPKDLLRQSIFLPHLDEQKEIGNFLKKMDSLITLHQRKLEHLQEQKKGLLQKMFPKNGETVPEVRFPGFTDAWEQRKLGEEFKRVNERNNGEFGKDRWISVAKMYFQDPDKVTSNNIDTRTYVMRFGDIAFEGHPNNEFKFGRFVANDIGDGVVSELFPIYRHIRDYDNNYWKYAIHLERIMGPIFAKSITSSGNSSNKLAPKDLLRQSIFLPHLDEQKEIGNFLKKMDSLITLHQRKLEHLELMKKGLLQQMFV
ncbi:restriction endonuclease subunit S [Ligilactobacillus salivarius]|uniref:restriction endonuclease subunit S n=1 Tax=Ligilactobacillus salivarius TaxID=1624 RepID=UPI00237D7368|nr:restriction endonuclease subunit S [Ligilactobacillus salivarius]MDE1507184.1 restriction endonuclease subunit S [Ligilactobacillus salivarius]MDE1522055.1 restriction endonuclease subunit S [Ligilactobacillus salivarius]